MLGITNIEKKPSGTEKLEFYVIAWIRESVNKKSLLNGLFAANTLGIIRHAGGHKLSKTKDKAAKKSISISRDANEQTDSYFLETYNVAKIQYGCLKLDTELRYS